MFHDSGFPADHLAIAAFKSPDAAAGADVAIVDAFPGEFLGAANVVNVVGIAAIDERVADFEVWQQFVNAGVDDGGRNHQPNGARLLQFLDEIRDRAGAGGSFSGQLLYSVCTAVENDALMTAFSEAAHHVGTHSSE